MTYGVAEASLWYDELERAGLTHQEETDPGFCTGTRETACADAHEELLGWVRVVHVVHHVSLVLGRVREWESETQLLMFPFLFTMMLQCLFYIYSFFVYYNVTESVLYLFLFFCLL